METQESKIDLGKALDASLVVMESSGTGSGKHDTSSRSVNDADADADDAYIRSIYDEEPLVEVQLTTEITQHYFPNEKEFAFAKPNHMIASSESRNSSKNMSRFSSNDMVHNQYLDEAKKKTQERDKSSKSSVMPSVRFQSTADDSKLKPRSTNHSTRSFPRRITILVKEANLRAKVKSYKTRNSNNPIEQKSHTQKPGRQIFTGYRFSPTKSSVVYEKKSHRSCLRWKPTGRIFGTVSLRWIPTGKLPDSCTGKVNSKPPHGSNVDIFKIHECKQSLDLSVGTSINVQKKQSIDLSARESYNVKKENLRVGLLKRMIS
uniref:Uncharacterized protein n=1 Tax=Tanacetum cinerariifolium TaxID=118510 RepID=A0A699J116_TANCI|nr:hypothetical protein [Tanacetum cinerariifolium]